MWLPAATLILAATAVAALPAGSGGHSPEEECRGSMFDSASWTPTAEFKPPLNACGLGFGKASTFFSDDLVALSTAACFAKQRWTVIAGDSNFRHLFLSMAARFQQVGLTLTHLTGSDAAASEVGLHLNDSAMLQNASSPATSKKHKLVSGPPFKHKDPRWSDHELIHLSAEPSARSHANLAAAGSGSPPPSSTVGPFRISFRFVSGSAKFNDWNTAFHSLLEADGTAQTPDDSGKEALRRVGAGESTPGAVIASSGLWVLRCPNVTAMFHSLAEAAAAAAATTGAGTAPARPAFRSMFVTPAHFASHPSTRRDQVDGMAQCALAARESRFKDCHVHNDVGQIDGEARSCSENIPRVWDLARATGSEDQAWKAANFPDDGYHYFSSDGKATQLGKVVVAGIAAFVCQLPIAN